MAPGWRRGFYFKATCATTGFVTSVPSLPIRFPTGHFCIASWHWASSSGVWCLGVVLVIHLGLCDNRSIV